MSCISYKNELPCSFPLFQNSILTEENVNLTSTIEHKNLLLSNASKQIVTLENTMDSLKHNMTKMKSEVSSKTQTLCCLCSLIVLIQLTNLFANNIKKFVRSKTIKSFLNINFIFSTF